MNEHAKTEPFGEKGRRQAFVYSHIVSFEETNLVGNVYFARHIAWQGRCREMFLQQHVPQIPQELATNLRMVTIRTSCDYYEELLAFDEVQIEMRLAFLRANRIGLNFDYHLNRRGANVHAARGFQEVGCFLKEGGRIAPCSVPQDLVAALVPYSV